MALPVRLRGILGDDDARKLILPAGMPGSTEDLCQTIKDSFGMQQDFRLQYQDADFGNEFVNLTMISEISDKATVKVVYLQNSSEDARQLQDVQKHPDTLSISSADTNDTEPASASDSSPSRQCIWPDVFVVPPLSYEAELELEKANAQCQMKGTLLSPSPKLKSQILQRLSEEIVKFKVYPSDLELNDVAEALKYKMANLRTRLRGLGCAEVMRNSLKNKNQDKSLAALNVKKPRRAEVNYCPEHPKGETTES